MKKETKIFGVILLVSFMVGVGLFSICSAAEKEVLIVGIIPATGPVADFAVRGLLAMQDAYDYFNKQGGIDGVKVNFKWEDNRYKVPEAISIYKKYLPQKPIGLSLWNSSGAHEALKEFMETDKIPGISIAMSDPQFYPPGWIFADSCGYGDQSAAFFNWFKSKFKEKRNIRIGYLGWDAPYGRAGYEEMKKYTATRGGEVVAIEYTTYAPVTVIPQLLRLKELHTDYIWVNAYNTTLDVVLKEIARGNMKMTIVGNSNEPTDDQITASGKDVTEGYIGCHGWYSEDFEDQKNLPRDFLDLMKKAGTRRGEAKNHGTAYSRGWQNAMFFREAIRLALKEVGYERLNGESLMKYGFMRMKNYTTPLTKMPGGLESNDDRRLNPYVRFYQAKEGRSVPVSDWLKAPWLKKEVEGK